MTLKPWRDVITPHEKARAYNELILTRPAIMQASHQASHYSDDFPSDSFP